MTTAELNSPHTMDPEIHVPQIPYDLLGPIFEHLKDNKASLCAISLASSTFRQEAQRVLFREVSGLFDWKKDIAFLRAVVASPTRLALFVHTYVNREYAMDAASKVIAEQALKAMCNLKCLILIGPLLDDGMRILRDCRFRLERFDGWAAASTSDDELSESFLPRQNTLKHLGLEYYEWKITKLADDQWTSAENCPQLVSIRGGWDMIEALLPGRKITTLSISNGGIEINATTVQSLAMELKYIKALSLSLHYMIEDSEPRDVSVLQHFPSLETLEVTDLSEYLYLLHIYFLPSFFQTLSGLTALQTLVLTDTSQGELYKVQEFDMQFVPSLFDNLSKNLKYIDIQHNLNTYTRYTRNSRFEEAITEAAARKVWLAEPIA